MDYRGSSVTLSKKLTNGHSFSDKSMYDGVFAAPAKLGVPTFSSRVEDYSEIFGGSGASRGSSIPILEVPELNERKISVDVGSSKLDYSKIFGGFGDSDFAVPYEELQTEPKKTEHFSDEARYEAEKLPPSKVADYCSEGNHVLSHEASYQSFDGAKKFSMSYHKINNGNGNSMNGTRHIAQLHAVPGYTCLIDEVTTSRTARGDNPVSSAVNDACSNNGIGMGKMEGKDFRKSMTDLPAGGTCKKTSRGDVKFQTKSNQSRSYSGDEFFSACEVGNGTFYSKVPPSSSIPSNLGNNNGNSETSMASKFGSFNFKTDTSEGSANAYSPPYFDEEVDTNSVAAISVAALKKAIEKAQARIKIAKESRERKKTSNRVKLHFDDGHIVEERKEVKIADKVNKSKNKKTHESHEDLDVPLDISPGPGTRKQNVVSQSQVAADFEVLETFSGAKEAGGETLGKEFRSSQADHWQEEAEIFEESEQFYEVAKESDFLGKEFRSSQENYKQEESNYSEEEEQFYEVSDTGQHWDTLLEFEEDKNAKKMMHSLDGDERKENKTANEVLEKPEQGGKMLKPAGGKGNPEETDKCFERLNTIEMASECEKIGGKLMSGVDVFYQEENEKRLRVAQEQGETVKKVQDFHEKDKCQKEQRELQESIKDDKILEILEVEDIEHLKRQLIPQELVENKIKGEETSKQEELVKELKDFHWVEDTERRIDKASNHEISEERLDFNQREEIEKRFIDESPLGKNKELLEVGENEKIVEVNAYQEEENEKIFKVDAHQEEENEKIIKVDAHQKEEKERIFKVDAYVEEENEKIQEETCESVEDGGIDTKIELSPGNEKIEAVLEDLGNQENNVEAADNHCRHDESDSLSKHQKSNVNVENKQAVEVSLEIPACEESGSIREVTETLLDPKENVKELELVEVDNDMLEGKTMQTDCLLQGFKISRIMAPIEDTIETPILDKNEMNLGRTYMNFWKKQYDQQAKEIEIDCNSEKYVEDLVPALEKMNEDVEESEVSMHQEDNENDSKCFEEERWVDNEIDIEAAQLSEISEREIKDLGLVQEIKTSLCTEKNHEIHTETLTNESAERNVENHQETLTSLNAKKNETKYETLRNQSTKQNEENCQEAETSQTPGANEENLLETLTVEESENNEGLQKEVELEKEHLRKIDEAKEREREKERIAVERAVREARERAFAEAKERAAEARQRVMAAEARERLGKTSAEGIDMSIAEKASMEAKRKAERAAVERATAEARERALVKALSGKAASETRKQAERFGAERVSGAYRENGMRHSVSSNDPQPKGSCSSSNSRSPNSSNHCVPCATERSDGANAESAQRCKARLERHQRTAERAAKALAEKNMRDLLAQKEQAERNRFAEVLDAEVKRWSSGKTGNLRALLSTLQYILGPDSGWHPIPLTDIITTTAVKKAYRKATLFVHPDKLQQRGASIQQKYTCEKVFDLLKEAWNRFNMEERY